MNTSRSHSPITSYTEYSSATSTRPPTTTASSSSSIGAYSASISTPISTGSYAYAPSVAMEAPLSSPSLQQSSSSSRNHYFTSHQQQSSSHNYNTRAAAAAAATSATQQQQQHQLAAQAQAQLATAQNQGNTASPFLRDFNLVAEAAKRAQMAVLMRDMDGIGLS